MIVVVSGKCWLSLMYAQVLACVLIIQGFCFLVHELQLECPSPWMPHIHWCCESLSHVSRKDRIPASHQQHWGSGISFTNNFSGVSCKSSSQMVHTLIPLAWMRLIFAFGQIFRIRCSKPFQITRSISTKGGRFHTFLLMYGNGVEKQFLEQGVEHHKKGCLNATYTFFLFPRCFWKQGWRWLKTWMYGLSSKAQVWQKLPWSGSIYEGKGRTIDLHFRILSFGWKASRRWTKTESMTLSLAGTSLGYLSRSHSCSHGPGSFGFSLWISYVLIKTIYHSFVANST